MLFILFLKIATKAVCWTPEVSTKQRTLTLRVDFLNLDFESDLPSAIWLPPIHQLRVTAKPTCVSPGVKGKLGFLPSGLARAVSQDHSIPAFRPGWGPQYLLLHSPGSIVSFFSDTSLLALACCHGWHPPLSQQNLRPPLLSVKSQVYITMLE